jgi:hypothetical protein
MLASTDDSKITRDAKEISPESRAKGEQASENASELLAEVYKLLEEYAPTWYAEELRSKLQAALRIANR